MPNPNDPVDKQRRAEARNAPATSSARTVSAGNGNSEGNRTGYLQGKKKGGKR